MKQKSPLVLARELAQKENWEDAYKICKEYLVRKEDDDSWAGLGPEEHEELVLLKIKCVIKSILLQDLCTGERDDDGLLTWKDDHNEIVNILFDSINELSGGILLAGGTSAKIEWCFSKVTLIAKEHYLSMLDHIIEQIGYDEESLDKYVSYFGGYCCLCQTIMVFFLMIADELKIKDRNFIDIHYNNAIDYQANKLYDRAISIANIIDQSTNDFPYFDSMDGVDVIHMYMRTIYLVGQSLPKVDDASARDVRISRLKHKINLICDFLNAILVTQGHRVSLCAEKSERERLYKDMLVCEEEIRKYDRGYSHPQVNREIFSTIPPKNKFGGCYVATAVYGSYDCPQVWTLRRYRDYTLAETWYGRAFIKTYYAISPTLVKWLGHTEWFKKMWRGTLDRMVKKLQTKGFESTPYEDKEG